MQRQSASGAAQVRLDEGGQTIATHRLLSPNMADAATAGQHIGQAAHQRGEHDYEYTRVQYA